MSLAWERQNIWVRNFCEEQILYCVRLKDCSWIDSFLPVIFWIFLYFAKVIMFDRNPKLSPVPFWGYGIICRGTGASKYRLFVKNRCKLAFSEKIDYCVSMLLCPWLPPRWPNFFVISFEKSTPLVFFARINRKIGKKGETENYDNNKLRNQKHKKFKTKYQQFFDHLGRKMGIWVMLPGYGCEIVMWKISST